MVSRRAFLGLLASSPFLGLWPKPEWPPPLPVAGEVFWWCDPKDWVLRVSDAPTYEFGFTGFKPGDEQQIVGQIRMVAHLARQPLMSRMLHGVEP
jgi:hypothetical protein